jgi:hypothetical protein
MFGRSPTRIVRIPPLYFYLLILLCIASWQVVWAASNSIPPEWTTVYSLPVGRFRSGSLGAALAMTVLLVGAGLSWERSGVRGVYRLLRRVRSHPVSLILPLGTLIPGLLLFEPGNRLALAVGLVTLVVGLILFLPGWHRADLPVFVGLLLIGGLGLRLAFMLWDWTWLDEGFYVNTAMNMQETWQVAPRFMALTPDLPIYPFYGYGVGLYGLWGRIAGVGLLSTRSFSFVAGTLALIPLYGTARLWFGKEAAFMTAALGGLSLLTLQSAYARPDGLAMLAVSLALFAHVWASQSPDRPRRHALAGLAAGFALETHLTTIVVLAALGTYMVIDYLRSLRRGERLLRNHGLWWFGLGAVLPIGLYLYGHILVLPDPAAYFTLQRNLAPPVNLLFRLQAQRRFLYSLPEFALIILSAGSAALRLRQPDRHWLSLLALTALFYVPFGPNSEIHYTIPTMPILLGGLGAFCTAGFLENERPRAWKAATFFTASIMLLGVGVGTIRLRNEERLHGIETFAPTAEAIRAALAPDEGILGPGVYYPFLPEYRNYILAHYGETAVGPILTGVSEDVYWQKVFVERFPRAWIYNPAGIPWGYMPIIDSYITASGAEQVTAFLWLLPDDLRPLAGAAPPAGDMPLALIATSTLPDRLSPGEKASLHALWAIGESASGPVEVSLYNGDPANGFLLADAVIPAEQVTPNHFAGTALAWTTPDEGNGSLTLCTLVGEVRECKALE